MENISIREVPSVFHTLVLITQTSQTNFVWCLITLQDTKVPALMIALSEVLINLTALCGSNVQQWENVYFHVDEVHRNYAFSHGVLNLYPSEFHNESTSVLGQALLRLKYLAKENGNLYPRGSQFSMRGFYLNDNLTRLQCTEALHHTLNWILCSL